MKRVSNRKLRRISKTNQIRVRRPRPLGVSLARFSSALAVAGALLASAGSVQAATLYWGNPSGADLWQTAGNWTTDATGATFVGSAVPTTGDTVFFNTSNVNVNETISLNAATEALGLNFNNTGSTLLQSDTVATRTLTLGTGGITINPGAGAVTIGTLTNGVGITLGGAQSWTNSSSNLFTIQNTVVNAGNLLTLAGSGSFQFNSGFNSSVAAGSVALNIGTGSGSGTTVNFNNTATGTNSVLGDIAINGGNLIYNGGTQTTGNALGINGGTVYRQILLSNGGTFRVSTADYNVNVPTATNKGAGFVFNIGTGGGTFSVDAGRLFTLDDGTGAGTALTNTQLQGSGALTKTGLGVLSLGNATVSNAVFTGQILVTQGVLRTASLTTGVAFGSTGANTVISSGAALDLGISTMTTAEPVTISGIGAGALALYNAAAGNGTNAIYSSGATASSFAGPITLALDSTIGAGAAGLMTLSGGVTGAFNLTTNNLNAGGTTFSTAAVNNGGTITNSGTGAGTTTIASVGALVTGVIQNSATSQLTLSSATTNAYAGTTTVTQGTLSVAGVAASGSGPLGTGVTNVVLGGASTSGTLRFTIAAPGTFFRNFTINAGGGGISSTGGTLNVTPTATGLTGGTAASIDLTNGPLTLTSGATAATNYITIGSATTAVALFTGTNALNKLGAGTATLSTIGGTKVTAAAMPINIQAGTLAFVTTNVSTPLILGTGLITITTGATLTGSYTGFVTNSFTNPITITGASGTANITVTAGAFQQTAGAITFDGTTTSATILKLNNTNGTAATLSFAGAISGTGNIQFNPSGAGSPITLSGTQNQTGTISNAGSSTSTSTLSGAIGAGISGISQAGANPFTVAAAVPLSAGLNTFTSTGAGLWTFSNASTFTGAQPLTFNANSSGGITVSGTNLNHTGSVTNSGTNFGTSTISSAIGAAVTGVIQNSATSPLVLSGNNSAYLGTFTDTLGVLQFSTTAAMTGFTGTANANVRISIASGGILGLTYPTFTATNVTDLVNNAGGTYANVSFAATGTSIGLDTTAGSSTFASVLANAAGTTSFGLVKLGTNTLTLGTANAFTGPVSIRNGTLSAGILNSVTSPAPVGASSLGVPSSIPNGTISLGFGTTTGILSYTGAGENTDRVINLAGTTGGGGLDASGAGLVNFTSSLTIATGAKTLTLSGAGNGEISGTVPGTISTGTTPLTIVKSGAGTWTLSGTGNTATTLTISGGTFAAGVNGLTLGNVGAATVNTTGATAGSTVFITGNIILGGAGTSANGADVGALAGVTLDMSGAVISGAAAGNLDFNPAGTLILGNANTYQGQTQFVGTTVNVTSLGTANAAAPSSLGQPAAGNSITGNLNSTILLQTGVLKYVGTGETTDRALDFRAATTVTTLDQSGTGLVKFNGVNTATGAGIKVLTLQGSTAGTGEIGGVIPDNTAAFTTGITKAGSGTWTLSGVNTYTGPTTVNGGNLILSQGGGSGVLGNTGITINSGGTLSPLAGFTAGNTSLTTAGGRLTLNAGGTLNLADGTIGNFNLVQGPTFVGNAATFAGGQINFDINGTNADMIDVRLNNAAGTGLATSSGSTGIALNPIAGSLTTGNYTLINAGGTLVNSNFYLASPNLVVGGTLYNLSLSLVGTNEVLTVATGGAAAAPNTAYWQGTQLDGKWNTQPGGSGTATNWATTALGTPDTFALPTSVTNVIFTANAATNLSTTLEQNFTINSLTFTGGGTANTAGTTIASGTGTNVLTINAAALNGNVLGNGISVSATSGANMISADLDLGGSQTWTNNAPTNFLTISGIVTDVGGPFNLTTAGAGTIALTNAANTYSGITTINGGTLRVSTLADGSLPSSIGDSSNAVANLVFGGTGSLQYTGGSVTIDRNFTINAGITATIDVTQASTTLSLPGATGVTTTGILTKTGAGALTITGADVRTGNTVVNGGTLNITGTLTGNNTSTAIAYGGTAGNTVVNVSNNITAFIMTGANIAGSNAVYNQTAGTVTVSPTNADIQYVGKTAGYGYFNLTGGTFRDTFRFDQNSTAGSASTAAYIGGTNAILDNTAGEWMILAYSGTAQMTVGLGGSLLRAGATQPLGIVLNSGTAPYGSLNVAGGIVDTTTQAIRFGNGGFSNATGIVNLSAGTLGIGTIGTTSFASGTGNNVYYNFAGGTLKANAALAAGFAPASTAFVTVTNTVFGAINNFAATGNTSQNFVGGLTIDTQANAVALPVASTLLGATGDGIAQSSLTVTSGSGYIGAPVVTFTGGTLVANGTPATGYALINGSGNVTGIVITNPGEYTVAPTLTLTGGGGTGASVAVGGLVTNSNTGGLTKLGSGTLSITGAANSFGGGIDIKGGVLSVSTLSNGGVPSTLGQSSNAAGNLLLDGGILGYNGTVAGSTDRNFTLAASGGGFDASGTTAGTFTLTASNAMTVTGGLGAVNFLLQGSGIGAAGAGTIGALIGNGTGTTISLIKNGAGTWNITNNANTYSGTTTINGGILSVPSLGGTVGAGLASSYLGTSSNAAASLVLSGGTIQYTGAGETTDRNFTFGNATTAAGGGIDTTGATGSLVISGNMTGANAAAGTQVLTLTSLVASGANSIGAISDSSGIALTGVTKAGVGAWTLAGANAYSGLTTVSAGTLNITGTNTLASPLTLTTGGAGIVNINSSGSVNVGAISWAGATAGVVNLLGGTLLASGNLTAASSTATQLVFNGGTLKSNAVITISSSLPIAVLAGGGTIDTTGGNITSSSGIGNTASPGTLNVTGGNTLTSGFGATLTGPVNVTGTGTTVKLGSASSPTGLWTVGTGANLDLNNLAMSVGGLAGGGTILNTGASAVRTVTITGTGGNTFSGSIQQPTPSATLATGVTLNLASAAATQTFSGNHTYGGPTTLTTGELRLTGGSLANTAISIASNGTLSALPGTGTYTAGNNVTAAQGASLNIAANGTFNMVDSGIGIFSLVQDATFATAGLTLANANLNFELASSGADQIVLSGGTVASAITGTNTVMLTALGSLLTPGTYSLITAPGIAAGNTLFKFPNGTSSQSLTVGLLSYPLTLTSIAGVEQITVGGGVGNFTWTGQSNGNGASDPVWTDSPTGSKNFADATPAAQDFSAGSAVTFQNTNVITAANVTTSAVTIDASGVTPSDVTINNTTAVNYTFQNVSGDIGIKGSTGLTKTGSGKLTLLGVNTYTGGTAINGGIVNVGVAESGGSGPLGTAGAITFKGGALQSSAANTNDYSARFSTAAGQDVWLDSDGQTVNLGTPLTSGGGTLTIGLVGGNTAGTINVTTGNGTNTYTGATVINSGTLRLSNTGANTLLGILSGTPSIRVNTGGTLLVVSTVSDSLGFTAGKEALIINGGTVANNGTATRLTLINTVTMTGGFLSGTSAGDANGGAFSLNNPVSVIATSDAAGNPATISAAVSTQNTNTTFQVNRGTGAVAPGAPDLVISGPITFYSTTGVNGFSVKGSGILNLTGTNTYKGNATILNGTLSGIVNANSTAALSPVAGLIMGDTTGLSGTLNVNQNNSVTGLTVNTIATTLNTNTITIAPTKTLTVTGNVSVGPIATAANQLTKLTINGGGAFNVSAAAGTFQVGGNNTATAALSENATLDLTGLASTNINVGTGTVRVNNPTATNSAGNQSTLLLPTPVVTSGTAVTTITAANLNVGDSSGNGNAAGQVNAVTLGTGLTTLNVNTVNVGTGGRDFGQITYAAGNGTLVLRSATGGSSRAAFNIGTGTAATGVAPGTGVTNNVDFTGHSVDLLVSTLAIGAQNRLTARTDTLAVDTGTLDATTVVLGTNTGTASTAAGTFTPTWTSNLNIGGTSVGTFGTGGIDIGFGQTAAVSGSQIGTKTIVGNLNISGGAVTVANNATLGAAIRMSNNAIAANLVANSNINITGTGSLTLAGNIIKGASTGAGTATINLNGASALLDMSGLGTVHDIGSNTAVINTFTFTDGTLQNIGTVFGGITLAGSGLRFFNETGSFSGQVNGIISGSGIGLKKDGTGTITLGNASNSYSGATQINAGTLSVAVNTAFGTAPGSYVANQLEFTGNSTLQLTGSFAFGTTRGITIDSGVTGTVEVTGANIVTAPQIIAGVGGLTKTNTGTLKLTGSNSYGGATAVSNGTLQVSSIAASGTNQPLGSGNSAIGLGSATTTGTLEYTGTGVAADLQRNITVTGGGPGVGGGVIKNTSGALLTLSGTLSKVGSDLSLTGGSFLVTGQITGTSAGNSDLIVNGGASVTLTNATNNYDGPTRINGAGVLKNGVANAVPTGSSIILGDASNTNGTYDLAGFDQTITGLSSVGTGSRIVTNSAAGSGINTLTVTGSASFGGVIQNGNTALTALTKSTGGTLTLSGTNPYTGPTTISAGTLQIGNGTDAGSIATTSSVANSGALVYNVGTGTRTLGAVISGTGSLTQNSNGGSLTLTGANTYNGPTTIAAGATLRIGNGTDAGSIVNTSSVTNDGALVYNVGTGTRTLGAVISGTGSLTQNSSGGSLTLTGANTYNGPTTIAAGATLRIGNGADAGSIATTSSVANSGALVYNVGTGTRTLGAVISGTGSLTQNSNGGSLTLTGANTYNGPTTIAAGATLRIGNGTDAGSIVNTSSVTNDGALVYNVGTGTRTLGAVISGTGSLTQNSSGGSLTLTGANTYNGPTTIAAGATLRIGNGADAGSIATTSSVANSGALVYNVGTGTRTLGAVISGTGSLTQNSSGGSLTLTGANTYNGPTTIAAGATLRIGNGTDAGSIVNTSSVTNDGALVYNVGTGTRTLGAVISGTGSLTQNSNGGSLTLTGANIYNGPTNVTGGTLEIRGSISASSVVSVSSGMLMLSANNAVNTSTALTLGGTGPSTSGVVKFSDSVNNISATFGSLTLGFDSTLDFGAGTGGQEFNFSTFAIHTPITGPNLDIQGWTGAAGIIGDSTTDRLIFTTGSASDFQNAFDQTDISFGGLQGYKAIDLGINAGFEIVAVPEPSSMALLGAVGVLGLVGYRARRRGGIKFSS